VSSSNRLNPLWNSNRSLRAWDRLQPRKRLIQEGDSQEEIRSTHERRSHCRCRCRSSFSSDPVRGQQSDCSNVRLSLALQQSSNKNIGANNQTVGDKGRYAMDKWVTQSFQIGPELASCWCRVLCAYCVCMFLIGDHQTTLAQLNPPRHRIQYLMIGLFSDFVDSTWTESADHAKRDDVIRRSV